VAAAAAVALALAACGGDGGTSEAGVQVVATTSMLGDVVGDVVECAGGRTTTLMPRGADPHDFQASSAQLAELVRADLVVANGLGLEEGLADALASAEADGARVLEVAPLVEPIEFGGGHADEDEHGAEDEHAAEDEHGSLDPHFWYDVGRMAAAAELVGDELGEVTGDAESFERCGAEVAARLREVDTEVRSILAPVPAERRVLVTDHDAFGYFAEAYDFEVVGVVIPGGSTLAEPSSAELAALVDTITAEGVPAIFANLANPSALVDAVAAEVGSQLKVVELYVDSLGPEGSDGDTYAGMMTTNARRIAAALAG
jgi:zinc/manganese transport system substrate-binding protein